MTTGGSVSPTLNPVIIGEMLARLRANYDRSQFVWQQLTKENLP